MKIGRLYLIRDLMRTSEAFRGRKKFGINQHMLVERTDTRSGVPVARNNFQLHRVTIPLARLSIQTF